MPPPTMSTVSTVYAMKQQAPTTPEALFGENSVIFADFMRPGMDVSTRKYEKGEITNITRLLGDSLDEVCKIAGSSTEELV